MNRILIIINLLIFIFLYLDISYQINKDFNILKNKLNISSSNSVLVNRLINERLDIISSKISLISKRNIDLMDINNKLSLENKELLNRVNVLNMRLIELNKKPIRKVSISKKKSKNKKSINKSGSIKLQFKNLNFIGTIKEEGGDLSALVYLNNPNKVQTLKKGKYIFKIWKVIDIEKDKIIFQNYNTKVFYIKKLKK